MTMSNHAQIGLPFDSPSPTPPPAPAPVPQAGRGDPPWLGSGRPEPGSRDARLSYGAHEFVVRFVRMRRARRYVMRVQPDGSLRVTIPRGGSRAEARRFAERHLGWAERQRARDRSNGASAVWSHGTRLLIDGIATTIVRAGPWVEAGPLRVRAADDAGVRPALEHALRAAARCDLPRQLLALASRHGLEVAAVSIRNQRSRWGSCSRHGHIALNFRLIQMPPAVREYVLLHELMHLKQPNHSLRFWRLVESVCPAFRDAERWLKTTGRTLF